MSVMLRACGQGHCGGRVGSVRVMRCHTLLASSVVLQQRHSLLLMASSPLLPHDGTLPPTCQV